MLLKLNPFRKQLQRGLRRANAEVRRPFQEAQDGLVASTESLSVGSLYTSTLPEDCIRLLTVLSADESTVYCELKTYQQRLAPRYDAISYCWGFDTTLSSIVCNGFSLEVRRSVIPLLKTCLQRDLPLRPIWIDAICLDQGNADEKALHVPLMAEIYKRCTRTLIWLGEPDSATEDTIIWIKAVTKALQDKKITKALKSLGEYDKGLEDIGMEGFGEERWSREWKHTRQYLSRPWFRRLWTVQEAVLSWDLQIICGTPKFNMIPWKDLWALSEKIKKAGGLYRSLPDTVTPGHGNGLSQSVDFMEMTRRALQRTHLNMTYLKEFCQDRACTEPIDRLWGFLGLMPPKLVAMIKDAKIIDYTEQARLEYWKSYITFMNILCTFDPEDFFLLIFGDIGRGRTSPVPSWCVDFNAPRRYSSFETFRSFRAGFAGLADRTGIQWSLDPVASSLTILGFVVDSVRNVTTEYSACRELESDADHLQSMKELSLWLRECSRLEEIARHDTIGLDSAKALCSALFAVDTEQDTKFSPALLEDFLKLRRFIEALEPHLHEGGLEALESRGGAANLQESAAGFDCIDKLMSACDNRRLFVTQQGHIGLGPPGIQAGDHVCVFYGAGPMFVLQQIGNKTPDQGYFKLVGDAYLYGMMFGEAFRNSGSMKEQKFNLI